MSHPTPDRNSEIVRLRLEEGQTLAELGVRYGVTRERIRQIVKSAGVGPGRNQKQQRCEIRRVFRAVAVVARHEIARAHGTATRYNLGCSCELCREANAERARSRVGSAPPSHGASGYMNYGCRCAACRSGIAVYRQQQKVRRNVYQAVQYALGSGKLVKPLSCEDCGSAGTLHGHHEDYSKPLDVDWLCTGCHGARHAPERQREVAT